MIGGYRAVVWTDTLQAVVLFIGFLLTAGAALEIVGGWDGLQGVNAELNQSKATLLHYPVCPSSSSLRWVSLEPQPSANAYIQESRFQTLERHTSLLQACILHSLPFPQLWDSSLPELSKS